ncbi:MAG: iron ABC transporter permease [Planctomycetota bacterium]
MRGKGNKAICLVLLGALLLAAGLSLFAGAVRVPANEFFRSQIIQLRLARIVLAIVAGAGLSAAGVIFQALLRNPLAEPYVLGVSSGAGVGAAAAIVLRSSALAGPWLVALGPWPLPALAFVGALGTVLLVYGLAREADGSLPVQTLLLSGVIVSAMLGSILMFLVSVSTAENLHDVIWWLLGNLQIFDWKLLWAVATVVAAGTLVTVLLARDLNAMTLGDEPAAHLGLNVRRTRMLFFLLGSLMTAAAVAACGLIGFVGLIVPHAVRLALGPEHRRLVPASALAGGTFLVIADAFARTVMSPVEIPIGVVTALMGGPFFLYLLHRRRRSYWR